MSKRITLEQARAIYNSFDRVQRHLLADEFSQRFKAMLVNDMTADQLQDAADNAFIEAVRALGGQA